MKKARRELEEHARTYLGRSDLVGLLISSHIITQRRFDEVMATLKQVQDENAALATGLASLITLADEDHDELVALKNGGGASAADLDALLSDSQTKRAAIVADLQRNAPAASIPTGGTSTGGGDSGSTGGDSGGDTTGAGEGSTPTPTGN